MLHNRDAYESTQSRRLNASMVAEVPYNLTPRHPPSQVVDNLPRYAG